MEIRFLPSTELDLDNTLVETDFRRGLVVRFVLIQRGFLEQALREVVIFNVRNEYDEVTYELLGEPASCFLAAGTLQAQENGSVFGLFDPHIFISEFERDDPESAFLIQEVQENVAQYLSEA